MSGFNAYRGITLRNIKVYLKDRFTIVISMLTQIIILLLYLLFLKNNYVDGISEIINSFGDIGSKITSEDITAIVNSWLLSGVVGTSVITVAFNSLTVMVSDKYEKICYDYGAAPVKNHIIVLSYFSGAVINTVFVSSILMTAGLLVLHFINNINYTFTEILSIYGIVALGSISATLILMLFVSFFKKNSTYNAFGIMISAAVGFVIGAYIPVSQFGENIQTAVNLLPGSQVAGMLRNLIIQPSVDNVNNLLAGVDNGVFAENINEVFSMNMQIFDGEVGFNFMMVYTLSAIVLFLILNLIFYKLSSKNKG